jgi:hypothetical protein
VTLKVNDDGRCEVKLPWIEGHPPVPRNIRLAKKRLENVIRKPEEGKLEVAYDEVFVNWLQEGTIEEISMAQWDGDSIYPTGPL